MLQWRLVQGVVGMHRGAYGLVLGGYERLIRKSKI